MRVSVVIPVFNEVENVGLLYESLRPVLDGLDESSEIIFVDDGSTDGSNRALLELSERDRRVKIIEFRHNFGQTPAMDAGIHAASGEIVVTMDGDLQNDPHDIPMMVAKVREGADLVHGWRRNRHDPLLRRRVPSKIANWLISKVTGFPVHDLGCTLKAMRREIADDLHLYGEMHRFIPILAHWQGARCVEVVTAHHSRRFGKSKYGLSRTLRVLLDLVTVKYLIQYLASPMKLFGSVGLCCGLVGCVAAAATIWMKLAGQVDMTGNPLLLLTAFSWMVGIQFLVLGMLGELGTRTYYETQHKRPYAIRRTVNFDHEHLQLASRKAA